ncbi:hypothetical protein E4U17_004177 [Claviceps sp. LM77 group G4]|nr:hypothetical protein E4U17_004177 [Claviceps sp. LM77 group G4]KAG6081042.1 hypothetical protein E4U33_007107 [Claviceps sp. LM78 group G4]
MFSYFNQTFQQAINATYEKPYSTAFIAAGVLVAAAPGLAVVPALGGLGFGSLGPVAASAAAGIQSGIGNVAAGSIFATLQSAGMGGAGTVVVNAAVSGAGAAGSALKAFHWWKTSGDGSDDVEDEEKKDGHDEMQIETAEEIS